MVEFNPKYQRQINRAAAQAAVNLLDLWGRPRLWIEWTEFAPVVRRGRWWQRPIETTEQVERKDSAPLRRTVILNQITYHVVKPLRWQSRGILGDAVLVLPDGDELVRCRPWNTCTVTPGADVDFRWTLYLPAMPDEATDDTD